MKTCMSCKYSYIIGEWADCRGCKIVDTTNNILLKTLSEEGNCPYYFEKGVNEGWGAK